MPIKNVPVTTNDPVVNLDRNDIEQRGEWFYFIVEEAKKNNVDWEAITRPAVRKVGQVRGARQFANVDTDDFHAVAETFTSNLPRMTSFEKELVKCTDDEIIIDHHYCPLLAAWQKQTDDQEVLCKYCDIAMEGDRGIFENIKGATFHLDSTLAEGDPVCRLRITKNK